MTKLLLRSEAITLRIKGYSYTYIQHKLGISKSTLSLWLRDIPYKPNAEMLARFDRARRLSAVAKHKIKNASIAQAKKAALRDIGSFTGRDFFILGIGLYIGEGSKTGNIVRITNSDPNIIKTSVLWFKKLFCLQNDNFSIRIHLYPDVDQEKAIRFWSNCLSLPKSCFSRVSLDTRTNKKRKNAGKLPYGTAHVTIKANGRKDLGASLFRRIMAYMAIVYKEAGMV